MVYDYIVIGSGFGGSVASLRLVEKGYKILTIEQGRRYKPADFPKTNWNLPKYLWVPALRFFGFQKLSLFTTASILSGTGVGGGSLMYANTLYILSVTAFLKPKRQTFRAKGIVVAAGTLGTLNLLLKLKYKYATLTGLSEKLGFELRTNAETLCALSDASRKLNNGLAITSVFSPDKDTHIEIVKYPDRSNVMKLFFGLSAKGAKNTFSRSLNLIIKTLSPNRPPISGEFCRQLQLHSGCSP